MNAIEVTQVQSPLICEEVASWMIHEAYNFDVAEGVVEVRAVFRFADTERSMEADYPFNVCVDGTDFVQSINGCIDRLHRIAYPHMDSITFVRLM